MANVLKIKRGSGNPGSSLQAYELGWDTSTNSLYIGNGVSSTLIANAFGDYLSLDSAGNLTLLNDMTVHGSTTLGTDSAETQTLVGTIDLGYAGKMTTVKGTLNVDQAVTFDTTLGVTGNTTLGVGAANTNTIYGTVNLSNLGELTTVKGGIQVDQGAYIGGKLTINDDVTANSKITAHNLDINTNLTIDSDGNVATNGSITCNSMTVNGTLTYVNTTVTEMSDPVITLGAHLNDTNDRGIEFKWNDGNSDFLGFFGWDKLTSRFTFIPSVHMMADSDNGPYYGTVGDVEFGEIYQSQYDDMWTDANGTVVNASAKWNLNYKKFKDGIENALNYEIMQYDSDTSAFIATSSPSGLTIDCGSY